jgi:hypothetical protein
MANLMIPPPFVNMYAFCKDDTLPKFKPDNWIEKNKIYRIKYIAQSLNTDELAITLIDNNGEEINPSETIKSFKSERFDFFEFYLN